MDSLTELFCLMDDFCHLMYFLNHVFSPWLADQSSLAMIESRIPYPAPTLA